jgi:hypothetical protein
MRAAGSMLVAALLTAGAAHAQHQLITVQMQCRDLSASGNFIMANETYLNGMACHPTQEAGSAGANVAVYEVAAESKTATSASESSFAAPAYASGSVSASSGPAASQLESFSVYIAPMQGFDNYLAAAFKKKSVPLSPVINESRAAYAVQVYWPGNHAETINASLKSSHADAPPTLQLVDRKSGAVVFAYVLDKNNTWRGEQATAEVFASHVKENIGGK